MTPDVALVLAVLLVTIFLFVTELLRSDVVALLVMLALPWLGLIEPSQAFRGFASAAVISIMAVIVLGHGLERSGVTHALAQPLKRLGGGSPRRLMTVLMAAIGALSAFIQNVGAAALFLPIALRVGRGGVLRPSQILMPLGFAAILGGTLTMIGSSPMIVLNDLVASQGERPFDLFAVTPIGLSLLGAGILLFAFTGTRLLPERPADEEGEHDGVLESWSFLDNIQRAMVRETSPLVGMTRRDARLIDRYGVHVVAVRQLGKVLLAPSTSTRFEPGQRIALLGKPEDIARLAREQSLRLRPQRSEDERRMQLENNLYAELLLPPGSPAVGQTMRDVGLRRNHGVEPLALLSGGESHLRGFADRPLVAGDMILVHGQRRNVRNMGTADDFVVLTQFDAQEVDRTKATRAVVCFLAAILLALAGFALPVALLSGALGMVLLRVVTIDDVYRAISWRTVFLLAGLIPLGLAMESTGAAAWLAGQLFRVVGTASDLVVLLAVGGLTTLFTLFLSNVATTVVLVPLAMGLGRLTDIDPRALALLVAVCAQNSFVLPTHQVNALLMAPGGYRNADYLRAGGAMSVVFLAIAVLGIWLLWL